MQKYYFSSLSFLFKIALVIFFGTIIIFKNAMCATHHADDCLEQITKNVVGLYISTEAKPDAIINYNKDMKEKGWKLHRSSHFKIATGDGPTGSSVLLAQSNSFLAPGVNFESYPSINCRELKSVLESVVSPSEFSSFADKYKLEPDMPTVPKMFRTVYSHLTDDKEIFSDLLEAYKDHSHTRYALSGRSLVSLFAIALKIKKPRMPFKLIVFGGLPEYTHDFLKALDISYETHSSVQKGFPENYHRFIHRFS